MSQPADRPPLEAQQGFEDDDVEILEVVGIEVEPDEEDEAEDPVEEFVVSLDDEPGDVRATDPAALAAERERVDEAIRELEHVRRQLEGARTELETERGRSAALHEELEAARSRFDRDLAEQDFRTTAGLAERLLPVIDNLERGLDSDASDDGSILDGLRITQRQLMQELGRAGLEPIECVGQTFNPRYHEAVEADTEAEVPIDTVVAEHRKGYLLAGRLLRASLVRVRVEAAEGDSPQEEDD